MGLGKHTEICVGVVGGVKIFKDIQASGFSHE
jgi:hypothetical protein